MSGAAPRFRYKREGDEARAWKRMALSLEQTERENARPHPYPTLYPGLCELVSMAPRALRVSMRQRVRLFHRRGAGDIEYFWPVWTNSGLGDMGHATDRITAAWLCYWMAREEGK